MIRAAKFGDIPAIAGILERTHAASRYAGHKLDKKAARAIAFQSVQRSGLLGAGGTCAFVAEAHGQVNGVLLGIVQQLYMICEPLEAMDLFFICEKDADPLDAGRLVDAFTLWANGIPDVVSIKLSATDAAGPWRRVERLFSRKGYGQCGVICERNAE